MKPKNKLLFNVVEVTRRSLLSCSFGGQHDQFLHTCVQTPFLKFRPPSLEHSRRHSVEILKKINGKGKREKCLKNETWSAPPDQRVTCWLHWTESKTAFPWQVYFKSQHSGIRLRFLFPFIPRRDMFFSLSLEYFLFDFIMSARISQMLHRPFMSRQESAPALLHRLPIYSYTVAPAGPKYL